MAPPRPGQKGIRTLHGGGRNAPQRTKAVDSSTLRASEATSLEEKFLAIKLADTIDESMGFPRFDAGKSKIGWLCNMHGTTLKDERILGGRAAVDFYFIEEDGETFKSTVEYDPYFLIAIRRGKEGEVEEWCKRMFEGMVKTIKRVEKEDLSMPNHLLGYRRTLLQLDFANISDLMTVRRTISPIAEKNKEKMGELDTYAEVAGASACLLYTSPSPRDS